MFSHQLVLQMTVRTSHLKQLDPKGPIASRGGSIPVFLRKPTATEDFPEGVQTPCLPSDSAHDLVHWPICITINYLCEHNNH